jgi:la-related protein 1
MGPIQTSQPVFDYPPPQSMTAVPYTSYIDYPSLIAMVTMQIEYYFSIDNLCKDVYLRKHMDSQGFVFLNFIAGFKRIQSLTQEFETLRFACQESEIVDFVRGDDGFDRLRRKEGWEKWVLAMDERDDSVRNAGPAYTIQCPHQRSRPTAQSQVFDLSATAHPSLLLRTAMVQATTRRPPSQLPYQTLLLDCFP